MQNSTSGPGHGQPDYGPDSPAAFATDLRALWVEAGEPSFVRLAKATGRAKTSLNNATLRDQPLASVEVVRALVGELAPGRVDEFCARRNALAGAPVSPNASRPEPPEVRSLVSAHVPIRWVVAVVVAAFAAFVAGRLSGGGESGDFTPASLEGTDPAKTRCVEDAEAVARREVAQVGVLELIHSAQCDTFWARATRSDDGFGQRIEVTVSNLRNREQKQSAVENDVISAYTLQVVRREESDRMCATGTVIGATGARSLGTPLC